MVSLNKLKETKLWVGAAIMAASTSLTAMPQAWEPKDDVKLEKMENLSFSDLAISPQLAWTRYQESADTRWLGLALSSLEKDSLNLEEQLLKARVLQALHQFDESLSLLAELKRQHEDHVGVRLLMSSVRLTQGETGKALQDCDTQSSRNDAALLYEVCQSLTTARMGGADAAYQGLMKKLNEVAALPAEQRIWVYGVLAELADQQGLAEAKKWYAYSLVIAPDDIFTRLTFADYLYRQQDWRGLQNISKPMVQHPRFAIWHAAASQQLGQEPSELSQLRRRMMEIEQRQDPLDYSDLAWYWLSVEGNADKAVTFAQRNWKIQQSLEDARLLMVSAQASGDQAVLKQVKAWYDRMGVDDQRMTLVTQRVGESS